MNANTTDVQMVEANKVSAAKQSLDSKLNGNEVQLKRLDNAERAIGFGQTASNFTS